MSDGNTGVRSRYSRDDRPHDSDVLDLLGVDRVRICDSA
jgi:hypothetical protein